MKMLPVVILAGGLATRLRPITENIPKALVEIANEPFIFHQLRYLKAQGIAKIILCVGHKGEMIQEILKGHHKFGLNITYSFDGDKLLGTGGAIKKALPLLSDPFFVLHGDTFLPINFLKVQEHFLLSSKSALMTVYENFNRWDKSNVIYLDGKLLKYDKEFPSDDMTYIDYGLGVLTKSIFEGYKSEKHFGLSKIYEDLSQKSDLEGYPVDRRFYEIGSHEGLKETSIFLENRGEDKA